MKFKPIYVTIVKGNNKEILKNEKVTKDLIYTPLPNGQAYLMTEFNQNYHEKHGLKAPKILSKFDIISRHVLDIFHNEIALLYDSKIGDVITLTRKGWGKVWDYKIKKIEN